MPGQHDNSVTWQQISSVLERVQDRAGHGIQVVTPITKKSKKQVGVLFVDETNLWEGLDKDDDIDTVMKKGQQIINTWGSNLMTVGGELRSKKCSYTIHEMRPTKTGKWEYAKTTPEKQELKRAIADELDDL